MSHLATYSTELTGKVDQGLLELAARRIAQEYGVQCFNFAQAHEAVEGDYTMGAPVHQMIEGDVLLHLPNSYYSYAILRRTDEGVQILADDMAEGVWQHLRSGDAVNNRRLAQRLKEHYTVLALAMVYKARGFQVQTVYQPNGSLSLVAREA